MMEWMKRLLGRQEAPPVRSTEQMRNDAIDAGVRAAAEDDPTVFPRVTSGDLFHNFVAAMKDDKGVQMEGMLCAVGSLAGYTAGRMAAHRVSRMSPAERTKGDYVTLGGPDGALPLYFGELVNGPLVQDKYCFWGQFEGHARSLGGTLPDLKAMFQRVTRTIFTEEFGVPRMPEGRVAPDLPMNYVKHLWPSFSKILTRYSNDPAHFPVSWGLTARKLLTDGAKVIPPGEAVQILMECAIPMSKIGPEHVPGMPVVDLFGDKA